MLSIFTILFGEISHASLFFTGHLRNPWQMLAEPCGSAVQNRCCTEYSFRI